MTRPIFGSLLGAFAMASVSLLGCSDQTPLDQPPADRSVWLVRKDGSGDFTDIQDAVNAATTGDTIRVGPGAYGTVHQGIVGGIGRFAVVIVLRGANRTGVTIVSEAGPDSTIIGDSSVTDYAVIFDNHLGGSLSGFEIRGGGNRGVLLRRSGVAVSGNRITGATWGIHCDQGAPIVRGNTIVGNEIGLYAVSATLASNGNRFEANTQSGIWCADGSSAVILGDTLIANGTEGRSESAGLRVSDSNASGENLLIARGLADGVLLRASSLALRGCTIVDHPGGNGVRLRSGATLDGERLIIAVTKGCGVNTADGAATLSCCDVWGETPAAEETSCALLVGNENSYANPLFCNLSGGNYGLSSRSPCAPANSGSCGLIGVSTVTCD